MSKGFKGFLVGLVTLISIFLAVWVGLSIKNERNPIDEIQSWTATQEETKQIENTTNQEEDDVVIEDETTDVTQE